jgi:hypothetical protein
MGAVLWVLCYGRCAMGAVPRVLYRNTEIPEYRNTEIPKYRNTKIGRGFAAMVRLFTLRPDVAHRATKMASVPDFCKRFHDLKSRIFITVGHRPAAFAGEPILLQPFCNPSATRSATLIFLTILSL